MDIAELFIKSFVDQATKKAFEFVPQKFSELFGQKSPSDVIKVFLSGYFYREDLIQALLFSQDLSHRLGRTDFIDYDAYKDYYPLDKKKLSLKYRNRVKEVEFPFKEEINFILHPGTQIAVKGIRRYIMPSNLEQLTDTNLQDFLAKKKTYNGPNLRLASLKKVSPNRYECQLERAEYFPQVRTNLSVDYRLKGGRRPTLRLLDMNEKKGLKPLEQSVMVNTIGTSAVVYFRKGEYVYFLMKLRKQLGIYENMLGTTSGEVENPHEGGEPKELITFVAEEMKREFAFETGLNPGKTVKRIQPLAFTRDLIRGGKPQFFFLIEVSEVSENDFSPAFKKSIEGVDEFHDDLVRKLRFWSAMSPEFTLNLFYAFQALLSEKRLNENSEALDLDHRLA